MDMDFECFKHQLLGYNFYDGENGKVFYDPKLFKITETNFSPIKTIRFAETRDYIKESDIPENISKLKKLFLNCKNLKSVEIPSSVICLDDFCFLGCQNLEQISIPDSVQSLGCYCFANCTSLKEIVLPDSIKSIGDGCFFNCKSLKSITIPPSVQFLGQYCFENCPQLDPGLLRS